jgi:hypothetical protein
MNMMLLQVVEKVIGRQKRTLKGAATMKDINVLEFGSRRTSA